MNNNEYLQIMYSYYLYQLQRSLLQEINKEEKCNKEIIYDNNGIDFTELVPREIALEIFSYLNAQELASCCLMNRKWQMLANNQSLWDALPPPAIAFDKRQWKLYFGDIGEEPRLPREIYKILKSPCPFWPGKKVEDTHVLVLIPKTVNGEPLNLKTLGDLVKDPKMGNKNRYSRITDLILNQFGDQSSETHWVLMTKNIIPGSEDKSYKDQHELITKKTQDTYEVAHVLDAVTCIFMHHVRSKYHLFDAHDGNVKSIIFTKCQEEVSRNREKITRSTGIINLVYDEIKELDRVLVGVTNEGTVYIMNGLSNSKSLGAAAERKFF